MVIWQITTPRLKGSLADPGVNPNPEDRVVRWQFSNAQAAQEFFDGIRLVEVYSKEK